MEDQHTDPRTISRILAVQYFFTKQKTETLNVDFFEPNSLVHLIEAEKYDTKLYERIIDGVSESQEAIDQIIIKKAPEWPIEKINLIDLIILRIAIWEGFILKEVPPKVAINEAIEIGKVLSSKSSSSFINGVLGAILNEEMKKNE